MPYANHRIVGVMELEPTFAHGKAKRIRAGRSLAAPAANTAIRRIEFDLADSRSTPRSPFEPTVKIDSATVQRELVVELAKLRANRMQSL